MRQLFAILLGFGFLVVSPEAQSRSILKSIERNLHKVEQSLCKASPSSKCKTTRKKYVKPKAPVAKPAPAPTPPPPLIAKPVPQPQSAPVAKPVPKPEMKPAVPVVVAPKPVPAPPTKAPVPKPEVKPAPPVVTAPVAPKPVPKPPVPVPVPAPAPPVSQPPASGAADNCLQQLAATGANFSPVPQPSSSAECDVPSPVKVTALKTAAGMVKLPDQPTLNCAYALQLESFVSNKAQPLAQSEMSSPIMAMGTGPGFDCRGRNGDSSAKISEHAKGNAVDIVFFNFADKSGVLVKDALNEEAKGFAFLRDVRAAACKDFTTVLGPGANSAHQEHFHIDLEFRKGGYRICQ
ncbi:extensin-like domain-containing protein [Aestuariivirga litoralis]|uniref:extensin-like domain-containing protein n=1 Tax=Aestuariivirga litoralis TaxID=2650924 RepID=UPI0018C4EC0F|nr:extensin family protein [Aestuariivirga litoralis]MBG1231127.1 extensin family protein [Aestuariivirga litoralis]